MSWSRRDLLLRTGLGLGLSPLLPLLDLPSPAAEPAPAGAVPRFTPPPGAESPEIAALIDRAKGALEAKSARTADLLASADYLPAHPHPRFRELVRAHARENRAVLVTPEEPGEPLLVSGSLLEADGRPVAGATLYAYQTSAKGWYSDLAPHISGTSGDERFARLFAYLRTDAQGRYELRTIRPAGYPDSNLPQHIHLEAFHPAGGRVVVTEIRFDDDPRLTPAQREVSAREKLGIFKPVRGTDGVWKVEADFRFPPA